MPLRVSPAKQSVRALTAGSMLWFCVACGSSIGDATPTRGPDDLGGGSTPAAGTPTVLELLGEGRGGAFSASFDWERPTGEIAAFSWRQDGRRIRWDAVARTDRGSMGWLAEMEYEDAPAAALTKGQLRIVVGCEWEHDATLKTGELACSRSSLPSASIMRSIRASLYQPARADGQEQVRGVHADCYNFYDGGNDGTICLSSESKVVVQLRATGTTLGPDEIIVQGVSTAPPQLSPIESLRIPTDTEEPVASDLALLDIPPNMLP